MEKLLKFYINIILKDKDVKIYIQELMSMIINRRNYLRSKFLNKDIQIMNFLSLITI